MIKLMPDKIASGATYCMSGGLVCNGLLNWYEWIYHLDWNFIGLVSGVILGIATFAVNYYYKRRDNIRRETSSKGEAEEQRIRTTLIKDYLDRSPSHDPSKAAEIMKTVNEALSIAEK